MKRELEECAARDEFQATRPPGCTCLSLGRRPPGGVEFCSCPDGIAAQAQERQQASVNRRRDVESFIARAGIPPRLAECELNTYPGPQRFRDRLMAQTAAHDRWSAIFVGRQKGVGKSGLAVSLLKTRIREKCEAGTFIVAPTMLQSLRPGDDGALDTREERFARLQRVPYLVLDEIGAVRMSEFEAEKLYMLIADRYDNERPTVFTSDRDIEGLERLLHERTFDRMMAICNYEVIEMEGPNLRHRNSGGRQ